MLDKVTNKSAEDKDYDNIKAQAKMLLQNASRLPTKWSDIFNSIEVFRRKVQAGRDKYDSTATESQVGLMSPMLIMFALMIETNMMMEPLDTNIIINLLSDNFKSQHHIDQLKVLLSELHPNKKENWNDRKQ